MPQPGGPLIASLSGTWSEKLFAKKHFSERA
jgi:hypothetical protein